MATDRVVVDLASEAGHHLRRRDPFGGRFVGEHGAVDQVADGVDAAAVVLYPASTRTRRTAGRSPPPRARAPGARCRAPADGHQDTVTGERLPALLPSTSSVSSARLEVTEDSTTRVLVRNEIPLPPKRPLQGAAHLPVELRGDPGKRFYDRHLGPEPGPHRTSSSPMYPPPTTTRCLGTSPNASAPAESTTTSPSTGTEGCPRARFPRRGGRAGPRGPCLAPGPLWTRTLPGPSRRASPVTTSTPFRSRRAFTFRASSSTTGFFGPSRPGDRVSIRPPGPRVQSNPFEAKE